jgi:type IV secretion system protein VirB1
MFLNILFVGSMFLSQCGAGVHPDTLNAIIKVESNYNELAINDNSTGRSHHPRSKEEAIDLTKYLYSAGHSLDVGLMQINSLHFNRPGIDYTMLFDPCYNVSVGAKILKSFYRDHSLKTPADEPETTLLKALSSYNTGSPYKGKKYVGKILKVVGAIDQIPIIEEKPNISVYYPGRSNAVGHPSRHTNSIVFFVKNDAPSREETGELDDVRKDSKIKMRYHASELSY